MSVSDLFLDLVKTKLRMRCLQCDAVLTNDAGTTGDLFERIPHDDDCNIMLEFASFEAAYGQRLRIIPGTHYVVDGPLLWPGLHLDISS